MYVHIENRIDYSIASVFVGILSNSVLIQTISNVHVHGAQTRGHRQRRLLTSTAPNLGSRYTAAAGLSSEIKVNVRKRDKREKARERGRQTTRDLKLLPIHL